jgi:hypothetical protein
LAQQPQALTISAKNYQVQQGRALLAVLVYPSGTPPQTEGQMLAVGAEALVAPATGHGQIKIICTPATVVMGAVLPFLDQLLLMVVVEVVVLVKQLLAITAALITALLVKADTAVAALVELFLQVPQILAYQELPILAAVAAVATAFVGIMEVVVLVALVWSSFLTLHTIQT